jgi:hypothetical protein
MGLNGVNVAKRQCGEFAYTLTKYYINQNTYTNFFNFSECLHRRFATFTPFNPMLRTPNPKPLVYAFWVDPFPLHLIGNLIEKIGCPHPFFSLPSLKCPRADSPNPLFHPVNCKSTPYRSVCLPQIQLPPFKPERVLSSLQNPSHFPPNIFWFVPPCLAVPAPFLFGEDAVDPSPKTAG